ncbi:MAG: type I-C CRISPR-associated protein Cas8c/Csd1 [Phycisphaerales bacterium JB050]
MILASLIDYYDRLAADPENPVPDFGFSVQQISFCVVLNPDGTLNSKDDIRQPLTGGNGKEKVRPVPKKVPGQNSRAGTALKPYFLWDNAAYMLGYEPDDPKPNQTRKKFEEFRKQHLARQAAINDPIYDAICIFLKGWDPDAFDPDESTKEALSSFGIFRVLPAQEFAHDRPAIRRWYIGNKLNTTDQSHAAKAAPSLLSGRVAPVARLHEPAIKGVAGSQKKGAPLVSFNKRAFESYGKSQGQIAPVAEDEAFKYCTALNALLADRSRRTSIGDATVVWWADRPTEVGESLIAEFFGVPTEEAEEPSAEDRQSVDRVRNAVGRLRRGLTPEDFPDDQVGFHVLGLSPNAARLSVRFWWSGSLGEMVERIRQHQQDLMLKPIPEREADRPITVNRMARETARILGDRPDSKTIDPMLSGEITRAVLTGVPYPMSLLQTIIRRVRNDGEVTYGRCAVIKACITRRNRVLAGSGGSKKEVPVSLNPEGPTPYQLGRLFAVLEKTQADAIPGVSAGIRDRYFGSASATPASIFPRLLRMTQHHMGKLHEGQRINRDKLIQEICSNIERFPRHLNLEEQGLFQIGYYHQRQNLYTKKSEPETAALGEEN